MDTSALDTATGEIMGAAAPAEPPQPSPNGQQAAKPSQSAAGTPGGHRTESAAGAATIEDAPAEYDDSDDPF